MENTEPKFYQVEICDVDDAIKAIWNLELPGDMDQTECLGRITEEVVLWCSDHGYAYEDEIYYSERRLDRRPAITRVLGWN